MANASRKRKNNDRKVVAVIAAAVFVICLIASIMFILGRTPDDNRLQGMHRQIRVRAMAFIIRSPVKRDFLLLR